MEMKELHFIRGEEDLRDFMEALLDDDVILKSETELLNIATNKGFRFPNYNQHIAFDTRREIGLLLLSFAHLLVNGIIPEVRKP